MFQLNEIGREKLKWLLSKTKNKKVTNLSAGAGGAGKILVVSMELGGHCAGSFLISHFPFLNHYRIQIREPVKNVLAEFVR